MEKFYKKILERLESLRAGRTVTAFAKACDIPQQTMANYCKGERVPSLEALARLCSANVVSADWLLGFTDDRMGHAAPVADAETARRIAELEGEVAKLRAVNSALQEAFANVGRGATTDSARATRRASGA